MTARTRWRDSGADLARALGTHAPAGAGRPGPQLPGPQLPGPALTQRALAWRLAWPVLIALALLGPLLAAWILNARSVDLAERRRADAHLALARWANVLSDQTLAFAEALEATRGHFEASDEVRPDEFALYTAQMLARHRVLHMLAWCPAVPRSERAAFESGATSGRPLRIWSAADAAPRTPSAADHFPIAFMAPSGLESSLLGLDLRGDVLRSRLLDRALATEAPVISEPLQLSPSDPPASGVLMALRVADVTAPRAEPRASGVLLLGFRIDDLLALGATRLTGERSALLATTLFGQQGEAREVRLGTSLAALGLGPNAATHEVEVETTIDVCGKRWRLRGTPTQAFRAGGPGDSPGWAAAGAFVGWELLLAAVAALVAGWHGTLMRRQSVLVDHVLRSLDEAVVVADRRGRIRMANEAAMRILGVPVGDDGLPRWPERLEFFAGAGGQDRGFAVQPMERAIAGEDVPEATYAITLPYASAPRSVAVSGHPIVDEQGALHGGVLVIRDVTEDLLLQKKAVALEVAGSLQQRHFPHAPPQGLPLDLAGQVRAAEETSGDSYDWLLGPRGQVVLTIGDVSGHGLPAALQMMGTRAYLRSQVGAGSAPDQVLAHVNASLAQELCPAQFVTLLCVEVDPATRRMRFANAGHPEGLLFGPGGELEARLGPTGPLLGVMESARYRLEEAPPLLPGRTLVLLTDGALECKDHQGRRFEEQRLIETVQRHREAGATEIVEAVLAALHAFAGPGAPEDDITVVVLKG